jgi:hypothetical protein
MTRLEKFMMLKTDHFHSKDFKRLSREQVDIMGEFILENDHLNYNEFAEKVNRLGLYYDWAKQKNMTSVWSLLTAISKTIPGMYGWEPEKESKWIHPRDKK